MAITGFYLSTKWDVQSTVVDWRNKIVLPSWRHADMLYSYVFLSGSALKYIDQFYY